MRIATIATLALCGALVLPVTTHADERILNYDSQLAIQPDGSLDVTENIRVRAEGSNIRRGIYRDFPTTYTDRLGNRVVVGFELLDVERDGHAEPFFTEKRANGVRISTGNDNFLAVPAEYTYTIHYRATRELGFFPDHEELYWNVTGLGWSFPIDGVHALVRLPVPVQSHLLKLDAYTGPAGAQGKDYETASKASGVAEFRTTRGLLPGEGMTIVVGFPKGIIHEPTGTERLGWFLHDNRGVLVGLVGLLLLVGFYAWRWKQFGRDPHAGPIFPRYQPPNGEFGPGELRMLRGMSSDQLCFASDVVDMAVRGYLQVHQGAGDGLWRLVREPNGSLDKLTLSQRALATRLFKEGDEIELKNTESKRVSGAIAAHAAQMRKHLEPRYFESNGGTVFTGLVASLVFGVVAFMTSGGNGIPILIGLGMLAVTAHLVFGYLLKAPTKEGRKLLDEIEGLRMYLSVAERDELKSMRGPDQPQAPALDAGRYEMLLPYAMALQVEDAWTRKFTAAVGVAAAQESSPSWYHGNGSNDRMGLANIGSSIGKSLSQQISSSSTPPGSSSGGGGGGSSGGGGGGGGGGGR